MDELRQLDASSEKTTDITTDGVYTVNKETNCSEEKEVQVRKVCPRHFVLKYFILIFTTYLTT